MKDDISCRGCQNSPAFDSSFCILHKPVLAMPQRVQLQRATSEGGELTLDIHKAEEPVGIITNKRKTRSSTFYEVNHFNLRIPIRRRF